MARVGVDVGAGKLYAILECYLLEMALQCHKFFYLSNGSVDPG